LRFFLYSLLDAEKRKYFKIEAHGTSSNPYSQQNVAKRRKAEEQETRIANETFIQAQQLQNLRPIQRWTRSNNSIPAFVNSREFGTSKTDEDRNYLQAKLMRRQRVWKIKQSDSHLERLTAFAFDEYTGDAVLGTHGGLVSAMSTNLALSSLLRLHEPQTAVTRFTSEVTSISLSATEKEKTLVCCSMGNEHSAATIHIGKFTGADERQYSLEVHAVMKPREKQALFCTTISKYTPDLFAVGAENVIFVSGGLREQQPQVNIRTNCFAVEFLGHHTLAAGRRNGSIR
jgi:hypothetical protein